MDNYQAYQIVHNIFTDPEELDSFISEHYTPIKLLGSGSFSNVVECVENRTQLRVAIKIIDKDHIKKQSLEMLLKEASFLQQLNHQNIVGFIDSRETKSKFYLVLELVKGEQLTTYMKKIKEEQFIFKQEERKSIVKQILKGLEYIHNKGIIHRDLKPDNIILTKVSNSYLVKIIDFGLSFQKQESLQITQQGCGTLIYMAPEVIFKQQYNQKVDIWSLGIIQFGLFGQHPLHQEIDNRKSFIQKIHNYDSNNINFPGNMNDLAISFYLRMADKLPENRMSASQALQHPWLVGKDKPVPLTMKDIIQKVESLKHVEHILKGSLFLFFLLKKSKEFEPLSSNLQELDERLHTKYQELEIAPKLPPLQCDQAQPTNEIIIHLLKNKQKQKKYIFASSSKLINNESLTHRKNDQTQNQNWLNGVQKSKLSLNFESWSSSVLNSPKRIDGEESPTKKFDFDDRQSISPIKPSRFRNRYVSQIENINQARQQIQLPSIHLKEKQKSWIGSCESKKNSSGRIQTDNFFFSVKQ